MAKLGNVLGFWAASMTRTCMSVCTASHEKVDLVSLTKHVPLLQSGWILEKNPLGRFNTWLFKLWEENSLTPPNITEQQPEPRLQRPGSWEGIRRPDYWIHTAVSPLLNRACANGISSLICLKGNLSAVTRSQILLFCSSALKDIYNLFVIYWNLPG